MREIKEKDRIKKGNTGRRERRRKSKIQSIEEKEPVEEGKTKKGRKVE